MPTWARWWVLLLVLSGATMLTVLFGGFDATVPEEIGFTRFVELAEDGQVERVTIDQDGRVTGELDDETPFETVVPTALAQEDLLDTLLEQSVEIEAQPPTANWAAAIISILPILLIIALVVFFIRRAAGGQMSQMQGMGKSQAQIIDTERPDTTFDDVAGYDEIREEVREIVDYLRDPERFRKLGARGPGGVLLLGPAGTGKTLMARAIAGEADVTFLSASGSEFVEMLVGVGAARVRDLFAQAREHQPAIIFIDELDSVGRKRGGQNTIGSNNEQEQTLNQLLKELDGFDPREGIVIIAATNRAEMLDDALLRPGRFDRQVEVGLPTQKDRVEILKVHGRGKPINDDVDLQTVARGTPGFSGAQLENLVNEAAINSVRAGRETITRDDFDAARDRIIIGKRQSSDLLREEEKHRVAVHETGHALVAAASEYADPVSKVTILPAQRALGTTEQLPVEERRIAAEGYLSDTLAVRLGGRVAERVALEELSSGAANDLVQATDLATRMVREFGLSPKIGPVGYTTQDEPGGVPGLHGRPYADGTQADIDAEVARLLREAEDRAERCIIERREVFDRIVERLLDVEVVDGEEIYALLDKPMPGRDGADPPDGEQDRSRTDGR